MPSVFDFLLFMACSPTHTHTLPVLTTRVLSPGRPHPPTISSPTCHPSCRLAAAQEERESGRKQPPHFHSRHSLFTVLFELCICCLMIAALCLWYINAVTVVQEEAFVTR